MIPGLTDHEVPAILRACAQAGATFAGYVSLRLPGAVAGGFLVGFVVTMLQAYLPSDLRAFRDAFAFVVVILVLLIRPAGLLPARTTIERV